MLDVLGGRGGLTGQITYSTDLFDPATVGGWPRPLRGLLDAALADPGLPLSRLPLLAGPSAISSSGSGTTRPGGEPAPDVRRALRGAGGRGPRGAAVVSAGGR